MPTLPLSDYISGPRSGALAFTPYGRITDLDLAAFLAGWDGIHATTLRQIPCRIDPTAQVHPNAIIGDDVIIGPRVRVHEYSTVRSGTVLCADVSVGFNCEVTKAFIGEGTVLGHRISLGRAIVGSNAHLSANVTAAAISMWSPDMRRPDREIIIRVPNGIYRCGTPKFSALIGDRVQTGCPVYLGPGAAIGRDCRLTGGVTLAGRAIPADHTVSAPQAGEVSVRKRRRRPGALRVASRPSGRS
ncbi:UDP-3-O-(3-hydroxymyristoyl)glucosamine N-acyltransferase [Streptomyces sp. RB5]|uniref:UDP-3-O-(3-hydroxymyristoyl)glucosamine N-acyltransferase n=1 Tax=Streptomyces smaragdinus TaxID=2585196 RepID=A0A7K0CL73_9ACTN|nr:transferase [Streptomyces smaragdinus]MQY14245.1 UDP-3-O-(3-hydroxymyristoyl)glucosamine N-acyltransferase [Streptomyces smaragdinus]